MNIYGDAIQKIVVINLGGIGDILLSMPALKALRKLYPKANISMLVTPGSNEVPMILSYTGIDRVFTFHIGHGGTIPLAGIFQNIGVLLALRKKRFDLAINMRTLVSRKSAQKIKFLFKFIRPQKSVGRDTEGRGYFFDIKIPEPDVGQRYEMEYDIDTVRALGCDVNNRNIDLEINDASIEKVNEILRNEDINEENTVIGIHPGGTYSHRWSTNNFSKLIDELFSKIDCKFVITGGMNEVILAKKLRDRTDAKITDLTGQLNIIQMCALIKRCNLYITNDTGPMHIAAILKTPLVAIFGPGYLERFDPRNISDKAAVLYERADCAPCNKVECDSMKCLKSISYEEVTEASLTLLNVETEMAGNQLVK